MITKWKSYSKVRRLLLLSVFVLLGIGVYGLTRAPSLLPTTYDVKSKDVQVVGATPDQALRLSAHETTKTVESEPIKTDFQFNAIAPHWKEINASEANRTVALRTSLDNKQWSPWIEIEAIGPVRDNDPYPDRMFTETPLMLDGRYFQYKVTLSRDSLQEGSPEIYDLKVNHIDSRKPTRVVIAEKIKGLFKSDKAYAAQQHPRIITRQEWGSIDPHGDHFKGTDRYWPLSHSPVKQVFIHHTVTPSYQADPSAAVRAVWDFQANTRGWGDIGYNYLIDHQGNVYEGRLGGDNVVAGHVTSYNKGSLGIALLGCFEPTSAACNELNGGNTSGPGAAVQDSLVRLLGNKMASFEIDPNALHSFCDSSGQNCLNLMTIAGHREAQSTGCPGNPIMAGLQNIRNNVVAWKNSGWFYSAKQLSYGSANLSANTTANVTLQFKNTGTTAWSKTGNKMSLYTMEPPGRASSFQHTSWLSPTKPAILNEATVAPGQTGSFTFTIKRPNIPTGEYHEGFTLITDNGNTPGAHYMVPIQLYCSIGQATNPRANGSLIAGSDERVYLIEAGKKRHITSLLAALTAGYNPLLATPVSSQELNLLANGDPINLAEGTLLKSPSSPNVYILDKTATDVKRRLITNPATMDAFGLKPDQIHTVDTAVINGYASGTALTPSSLAPDGRLIKGSNDHKVYLVEDGEKRWITSQLVFESNGFRSQYVGTLSPQKITDLPNSNNVLIRPGTLLKAPSSASVYITDIVSGAGRRRLVTGPDAFMASGFRPELVRTTSTEVLNTYTTSSNIECFK